MDPDTHACACGAKGDAGEVEEHVVSALGDGRDHRIVRGPAIERVEQARQQAQHRAEVRRKLAEAAGVSVDELDEALR